MSTNQTSSFLRTGNLNVIIGSRVLPSGNYVVDIDIATPPVFTEDMDILQSGARVTYYMDTRDQADQIMAGMAHAAAEYFSSRNEPEPDWDAIAAEMEEDYHSEEALDD